MDGELATARSSLQDTQQRQLQCQTEVCDCVYVEVCTCRCVYMCVTPKCVGVGI